MPQRYPKEDPKQSGSSFFRGFLLALLPGKQAQVLFAEAVGIRTEANRRLNDTAQLTDEPAHRHTHAPEGTS